jgi:hypothetical protein
LAVNLSARSTCGKDVNPQVLDSLDVEQDVQDSMKKTSRDVEVDGGKAVLLRS